MYMNKSIWLTDKVCLQNVPMERQIASSLTRLHLWEQADLDLRCKLKTVKKYVEKTYQTGEWCHFRPLVGKQKDSIFSYSFKGQKAGEQSAC